jgi:hypothetical protein
MTFERSALTNRNLAVTLNQNGRPGETIGVTYDTLVPTSAVFAE